MFAPILMTINGAETWAKRIKIGALLIVMLGLVGFMTDVFSGLPLTRESKSSVGWLFGMLGIGALWLSGEVVAEWIHNRDAITDPLWKRVGHLALLLAVVAVFWAASASLIR